MDSSKQIDSLIGYLGPNSVFRENSFRILPQSSGWEAINGSFQFIKADLIAESLILLSPLSICHSPFPVDRSLDPPSLEFLKRSSSPFGTSTTPFQAVTGLSSFSGGVKLATVVVSLNFAGVPAPLSLVRLSWQSVRLVLSIPLVFSQRQAPQFSGYGSAASSLVGSMYNLDLSLSETHPMAFAIGGNINY